MTGLGQPEGADDFAFGEAWQEALLLFICPESICIVKYSDCVRNRGEREQRTYRVHHKRGLDAHS